MWLSLVERLVWDQDAAGSNPVIPTISSVHNGFQYSVWTLDFFALKSGFFVLCMEQDWCPALLFYAEIAFGTYSTATPCLVSAV